MNKDKETKYLALVEKLMNFIIHNAKDIQTLPRDASFVAFSSTNKDLYNYAEEILESLKRAHEHKPIVKAVQKKSSKVWEFTTITQ